jgi:hypothetical protein
MNKRGIVIARQRFHNNDTAATNRGGIVKRTGIQQFKARSSTESRVTKTEVKIRPTGRAVQNTEVRK